MGTFVGHVAPGAGFCLIGLWHLFNTLRNYHAHAPWEFESRPWFPADYFIKGPVKLVRYTELYLIILGSSLSIAGELHFGLHGRHALDADWSIPFMNLNNFEHATISAFFLLFAAGAWLADEVLAAAAPYGMVHMLGALALSQELLIFHLHSADHMGLEGRYHWLLQIIIVVGIAATLVEIALPHSLLPPLVRSMSLLFQGVWFIQMGFVVFTPTFAPKGCAFRDYMVTCDDGGASLARAKALASLQFSWWLAGVLVFTILLYICLMAVYGKSHKYQALDQYMIERGKSTEQKSLNISINHDHTKSCDGSHCSTDELPSSSFRVGR